MRTRRKAKAKAFIQPNAKKVDFADFAAAAAANNSSGGLKKPEDFDLVDELIETAVEMIEKTEQSGDSLEELIMGQGAAAGLAGSREFDTLLRQTKGKSVPRGGSDDSRPRRNPGNDDRDSLSQTPRNHNNDNYRRQSHDDAQAPQNLAVNNEDFPTIQSARNLGKTESQPGPSRPAANHQQGGETSQSARNSDNMNVVAQMANTDGIGNTESRPTNNSRSRPAKNEGNDHLARNFDNEDSRLTNSSRSRPAKNYCCENSQSARNLDNRNETPQSTRNLGKTAESRPTNDNSSRPTKNEGNEDSRQQSTQPAIEYEPIPPRRPTRKNIGRTVYHNSNHYQPPPKRQTNPNSIKTMVDKLNGVSFRR